MWHYRQKLGYGKVGLIFLAVSFALNWPYLRGGFHADDILLLNMLHQDPRPFAWWKGLWSVYDLPAFTGVWWQDPGAVGGFWRPVASWVFAGSIELFGERALPLHLLSLVLHGVVAWTLFLVVSKLTKRPVVALLSGVFFITCEDHSMIVGWISTMTDILCVFFVNLSLLAYLAWLESRRRWVLACSLVALVAALGCKESAAIAPVFLILTAILIGRPLDAGEVPLDRRTLRRGFERTVRDVPSWLPVVVTLIVYLGMYERVGVGGMKNLLYIDPFTQPVGYLLHLGPHIAVMWLATLSPVPPSLALFFPETLAAMAAAGLIVFAVWLWAISPLIRRPLVLWALVVYLLGLLPQMATHASERAAYFPLEGGAVLLAVCLVDLGPLARWWGSALGRISVGRRAFGWFVLACVLIPGIALSTYYPFSFLPSLTKPERDAATARPLVEAEDPDHVIVLNASGPFVTLYLGGVLEYELGRPVDLRVLSACNAVVSLERVGNRSFVIRVDRRGWLSNMFARIFRTRTELDKGRIYTNELFSASFVELTSDGADALAVRFDFERPLDDPTLLALHWDGASFREMDIAALPVGRETRLGDTSDVWRSMW